MGQRNYTDLIAASAIRHGLPPELITAIVQVESAGNPWAVRYEPGFFKLYLAGKMFNFFRASAATGRHLRACSFGLMQVMGQVAREHGFSGDFVTELCDPATGLEWGCTHLAWSKRRLRRKHGFATWEMCCAAYNGGLGAVRGPGKYRNPQYSAKVLKALGGKWPEEDV